MGILTAIMVFIMIWWTTIFCVLPWGNKPETQVQTGNAPSAPASARIKRKFIITTIISIVLWLVIWGLTQSDAFSFRDWANKW